MGDHVDNMAAAAQAFGELTARARAIEDGPVDELQAEGSFMAAVAILSEALAELGPGKLEELLGRRGVDLVAEVAEGAALWSASPCGFKFWPYLPGVGG